MYLFGGFKSRTVLAASSILPVSSSEVITVSFNKFNSTLSPRPHATYYDEQTLLVTYIVLQPWYFYFILPSVSKKCATIILTSTIYCFHC